MGSIFKILFLFIVLSANAQFPTFIGMQKEDIVKIMETRHKKFSQNADFKNNKYNYLKFIDRTGDETLLVFLSEKEACTLVKLMTGYDNEDDRFAQLSTYKKTGTDKWETVAQGHAQTIDLKRDEWYMTFIVKPKN